LKDFEESASDWLWATDHEGRLGHVSNRFATVFGQSQEELRNCRLLDVLSVERAPAEPLDCVPIEAMSHRMANRKPFRDIVVPMIIKGEVRWLSFSGKATERPNGSFNGYRGVGSDVTTEKRAKERLAYLARHDALTGLANRMQFREGLNLAISRATETGEKFAILCIDLDRFKCVNDTRGHPFGDTLLKAVAERIRQCVDTHDIVARLGGDEFAIIQISANQPNNAIALAQQVIDAINQPFEVNGSFVSVGASVGLSVAPGDGLDADTLLKNADLALYRAKSEGRSAYRFFEQEMDARAQERNGLELDLRRVDFDQAFQLYFQPLHNVELGQVSGFEALIRWHHPTRGTVTPAEFIPIAEEIGIIKSIGEWVLRKACAAAIIWPDDISVAVNLSPLQFGGGEIVDIVRRALDASGLAPNRLELEITEGLLIQHTEAVLVELEELKGLGVSIAMDDFGNGYSSLSYLWRFPFDKIKIDRSFVSALGKDKAVEDILRTILSLGLQSKMCVVAEGVETEHQAAFLSEISCHQLQGFYFGKPVPESELPLLLLNQHRKKLSEHALVPAA
ncbi:MAG: EAL domain-containing protein, partial [Hyphomicrobiaceae bacterium]